MKLSELTIDPPTKVAQGGTVTFMEHGVRKVFSMDEYFNRKNLPPLKREPRVDDHLGAVGE